MTAPRQKIKNRPLLIIGNAVLSVAVIGLVGVRIWTGNRAAASEYRQAAVNQRLVARATEQPSAGALDANDLMNLAKKSGLVENAAPAILYIESGVALLNR